MVVTNFNRALDVMIDLKKKSTPASVKHAIQE